MRRRFCLCFAALCGFSPRRLAPKAWYFLLKGASGLEQSIGEVGERLELVEECRPLSRTMTGKEMLRLPSNSTKMKAASYITFDIKYTIHNI